ncbi:MAG: ABC transporter permease [Flavobacteriales bacterium]|jgi:phospholipid/cholesterol/gamma-HCH transport system permease protein|nr:ABC transporter permease [Flavobacteriales bacterium]MCW8898582.1 ABC transporter permease [Flavobacteriales bacterium]MCW8912235.1 ABC transporter permease [Flavobacteriales bacterium]MCW8936902.1 ABC transporter permease [Flavobacteriales bacterium]MCW8940592.1 ABC transporter permease [Flavobacteriales bacterium]|tara:strand:- start:5816 stop:6559 length:744 start_codon:yes stop_codon:yes gene_type:complete
MITLFENIGAYFILLSRVFKKPDNYKLIFKQTIHEMVSLGIGSLGLIAIISVFMGAVVTIQTATNMNNPLLPGYLVGFATRESFILELAPTVMSLILAGKIGSNVASEIGTMRISDQIDALEIMGVNSASYLVFPKIVASLIFIPIIVIYSMALGIIGGLLVSMYFDGMTLNDYILGIRFDFKMFSITYALIKSVFFAFIITSIPSYFGYYVKGGALEIGKASTKSVVYSSITILIINYLLTQMLLV